MGNVQNKRFSSLFDDVFKLLVNFSLTKGSMGTVQGSKSHLESSGAVKHFSAAETPEEEGRGTGLVRRS